MTLENASSPPMADAPRIGPAPGFDPACAQQHILPSQQAWLGVSGPRAKLTPLLVDLARQEPAVSLVQVPSSLDVAAALVSRDDFRIAFVDLASFDPQQLEGLMRGGALEHALAVVAVGPQDQSLAMLEAGVHEYVLHQELTAEALKRAKDRAVHRKAWEARRLERLLHDELTGLPLRTLFMDRLNMAIRASMRDGTPCALFFLDVDDFKQTNDTLGHQAGDAVLKEVGRRLRTVVRAKDSVARLGGDEFAVLMPGVASKEDAHHLGVALANAMTLPVGTPSGPLLPVTLSVGGVWLATANLPASEMLHHADMAMYQAKFSGKGQVRLL